MKTFSIILVRADAGVVWITRIGVILGMSVLFLILLSRVIARATETPIVALDEIAELATVWMILLGVIALWRRGLLYCVDFRPNPDSRISLFLELLVQTAMLAFAILLVWQGTKFTILNRNASPFLLIDMDFYYGAIPITFAVMALYSVGSVWRRAGDLLAGRRSEEPTDFGPPMDPPGEL
jgi:TRAP-type C4-dicarboxylate transport system permease small subunit